MQYKYNEPEYNKPNNKIDFESIYKNVSSEIGVSTDEVKIMLQRAVNFIFTNSTQQQKLIQDLVPRKGDIPTFEELMIFIKEVFIDE